MKKQFFLIIGFVLLFFSSCSLSFNEDMYFGWGYSLFGHFLLMLVVGPRDDDEFHAFLQTLVLLTIDLEIMIHAWGGSLFVSTDAKLESMLWIMVAIVIGIIILYALVNTSFPAKLGKFLLSHKVTTIRRILIGIFCVFPLFQLIDAWIVISLLLVIAFIPVAKWYIIPKIIKRKTDEFVQHLIQPYCDKKLIIAEHVTFLCEIIDETCLRPLVHEVIISSDGNIYIDSQCKVQKYIMSYQYIINRQIWIEFSSPEIIKPFGAIIYLEHDHKITLWQNNNMVKLSCICLDSNRTFCPNMLCARKIKNLGDTVLMDNYMNPTLSYPYKTYFNTSNLIKNRAAVQQLREQYIHLKPEDKVSAQKIIAEIAALIAYEANSVELLLQYSKLYNGKDGVESNNEDSYEITSYEEDEENVENVVSFDIEEDVEELEDDANI